VARSDAGAVLTAQHRRAQLAVRAATLRDFLTLWPLWQGDAATFDRLVTATLPLVRSNHRLSGALAIAYYDAFRRAEAPGGAAEPRLPAPLDVAKVTTSLHVVGRVMTRKALAAGQSPQAAMQTALIRTGGAVTRHVLDGGRGALLRSTTEDKRSRGWQRITSGNACTFCEELAAQGVASGEDFESHDHCSCGVEPAY
jgi:hypothetical protein